jgi:hypothetical protein
MSDCSRPERRERETPATAGGLQPIGVDLVMPEPLERAHDEESLTAQVEPRSLDAVKFAPAKSKVRPGIDEGTISTIDGLSQAPDFLGVQVTGLRPRLAGKRYEVARRLTNDALSHRFRSKPARIRYEFLTVLGASSLAISSTHICTDGRVNRPIYRHRRLDRNGIAAGRPALDRTRRAASRHGPSAPGPLPRTRNRHCWGRFLRVIRRPSARRLVRASAGSGRGVARVTDPGRDPHG